MPECQNCGSWVSNEYVRVHSRDGETVRSCPADDCGAVREGGQVRAAKDMGRSEGDIVTEEVLD